MTFSRLLLRNLVYHWRGNLAVCLGVAVGTAVLTGALLVGDSLRGSLRDQTLARLGWIEDALVAGRFFRAGLAGALPAAHVSPAILLQGAMTCHPKGDPKQVRRSAGIMVLGVDERFWQSEQAPLDSTFWRSEGPELVLNAALAQELKVSAGDRVTLHLQKATTVPRETLLGRRGPGDALEDLPLKIRQIIPDEGLALFTMSPSPQTPRNAFVPLSFLQKTLDKKDRANALFVGGVRGNLQDALRSALNLDDWNLTLQTPEDRARHDFNILDPRAKDGVLKKARWSGRVPEGLAAMAMGGVLKGSDFIAYYQKHHAYLDLESRQMFLEPAVIAAANRAAAVRGWREAPTLIYLADSLSAGQATIPYAVVAALDPAAAPPLGPFLPPGVTSLQPDEIVLADWKEAPLKAKPGDSVTLSYYSPDAAGKLDLRSERFRVRCLLPLSGPADDPDLTPDFPGITDKLDIGQWENPPFPYDPKRVKPADEDFWKRYRTTPKAYVTLAKGQALWSSRFGQLTSIRLAPTVPFAEAADMFRSCLLSTLSPEAGGFVFNDLNKQALAASASGTDFGLLFLGFSLFLIVAALLLVGLLSRLNLDRRASEIGILLATGFRRSAVRRLLLGEGLILAVVGGAIGCGGAVFYAWLLLEFLAARWPGGLAGSFLRLHVTTQSFLVGYIAAVAVSLLTIFWAVRVLARIAPTGLLAGQTTAQDLSGSHRKRAWSLGVMALCFIGAVAALVGGAMATDQEARAASFFTSGMLLLGMRLAGVWAWMRGTRHRQIKGQGMQALARLGRDNGARNPLRSLLTMGLLASATFLVIAVQSFHREPGRDFLEREGGSGGFTLLADSDVPLFQALPAGLDTLNLAGPEQQALRGTEYYSFRVHQGDDASCLNLYQPRRPRLFGVPHALIQRGGFHFAATEAETADERANPWRLLERTRSDGAIPVFGEANTVTWQLKKGLGQEIEVPNDRGEPVRLRIVGLFEDSVFQGELLLADASFLKLYPRQEGFQFFLIGAAPDRMNQVSQALETALADHGFTVTPTAQRLEAYLAVENTYLLTFQALGGLGLVLGSLGLGIVLLRSVWERRGELALLRALGYRRQALGWLVLAETLWLLLLGLAAGTIAAVVSTAPFVMTGAGEIAWGWLGVLLVLVFVVGLGAGVAALAATLRAPLLAALRRE